MEVKEFLDENYKLRRKLDKIQSQHIKELINVLKVIEKGGIYLPKLIKGYEEILIQLEGGKSKNGI